MTVFSNINIDNALEKILEQYPVTKKDGYRPEWIYLQGVLDGSFPDGGTLVWLVNDDGIECLEQERVFLNITSSYHSVRRHAKQQTKHNLAYIIEPKYAKDGKAYGNLYALDLQKYSERVEQNAVGVETITVVYERGARTKIRESVFHGFDDPEFGRYIHHYFNPSDPEAYQHALDYENEIRSNAERCNFEMHIADIYALISAK